MSNIWHPWEAYCLYWHSVGAGDAVAGPEAGHGRPAADGQVRAGQHRRYTDILSILILKLREVSEDHTYDTIEFNEVNSLTVLLHCWLFLTFLIENVLLSFILFVHLYSWKTLAKTKMTPNALLTQNTTCKKRYLRWKWVANVVLLKFLQMMSKQTNKPLTPKDLIEAFR